MDVLRECPLCGGTMRWRVRETVTPVPGNPRPLVRRSAEWTCPDCDYFEEAEEEND